VGARAQKPPVTSHTVGDSLSLSPTVQNDPEYEVLLMNSLHNLLRRLFTTSGNVPEVVIQALQSLIHTA